MKATVKLEKQEIHAAILEYMARHGYTVVGTMVGIPESLTIEVEAKKPTAPVSYCRTPSCNGHASPLERCNSVSRGASQTDYDAYTERESNEYGPNHR